MYNMEKGLLTPCGLYCGLCEYYTGEKVPRCSGCSTQQGHPFWGDCELFKCANEGEVEHCGKCKDFPCALFVNQYDPEQGQESAFTRVGLLIYRKKAGKDKYVEMVKKLKLQEK